MPYIPQACVYENQYVEVYTPQKARSEHHLVISAKRDIPNLTKANEDEIKAIHKVVGHTTAILGGKSFQLSHNDQSKTIELIPVWSKFVDVKNLAHKMDLYRHIYYPGQKLTIFPSPQTEDEFLTEQFSKEPPIFERKAVGPTDTWIAKTSHATEATQMLEQHQKEIEGCTLLNSDPVWLVAAQEQKEFTSVAKGPCPFCKPEIIESQSVLENDLAVVLLNFRHQEVLATSFLILPKRHEQYISDVTEQECIAQHQLECQLTEKLTQFHSDCQILNYVQDGPPSGQTVPHCHQQIVAYWPETVASENTTSCLQDLTQGSRKQMDKELFNQQVSMCRDWFN